MFGKISRRYYNDQNKFGPKLLIGSMVFILCVLVIVGAYKGIEYAGTKAEQESAVGVITGYLNNYGWTFDSIRYTGETEKDPLKCRTYYKYCYNIYGMRNKEGKKLSGTTFILYTVNPSMSTPYSVYSSSDGKTIDNL